MSKSHMCGIVASPNQHNLVGLGKRGRNLKSNPLNMTCFTIKRWLKISGSRNLSCDLRESFKNKGEDGSVSVLLVSASLHPHSLSLSPELGNIYILQCIRHNTEISSNVYHNIARGNLSKIAPANSLSGSCLSSTNKTDLFTIGPGSLNCFGPGGGKLKKKT